MLIFVSLTNILLITSLISLLSNSLSKVCVFHVEISLALSASFTTQYASACTPSTAKQRLTQPTPPHLHHHIIDFAFLFSGCLLRNFATRP